MGEERGRPAPAHIAPSAPPAAGGCTSRRLRRRGSRGEMKAFLRWFDGDDRLDPVLKVGVARFLFVTIHPLEDGNGRIARAIADMALARSERSTQRFYSMSAQIGRERKAYYDVLERSQKDDVDITGWLEGFRPAAQRTHRSVRRRLRNRLRFERARAWPFAVLTTDGRSTRATVNPHPRNHTVLERLIPRIPRKRSVLLRIRPFHG